MHAAEAGIPPACKRPQQVEGRRRLPISFELTPRVRRARAWREFDVIDNIAAIARQFDAIAGLRGRGAWLCELASDAAKFHDRQAARIGEHHRHLQEQTEEIADIVRAVFGETLGAIAALEQEGVAGGYARERPLQAAGLACKHQGRKGRKLPFNLTKPLRMRIGRELGDGFRAPAVECPTLSHDNLHANATPTSIAVRARLKGALYTSRTTARKPAFGTPGHMQVLVGRSRARRLPRLSCLLVGALFRIACARGSHGDEFLGGGWV